VRILILHSTYRSGPASGENRVVEDEARLLSEAGHQVDVYAPMVGDPRGLEIIRTGVGAVWSREAVAEVKRRIHYQEPDIVHCHNLFPALSPAVLRAVGSKTRIIVTLHNYRFLCLPATFFRDGRVCEDCLHRPPWPGIAHGCYQGSRLASAVLASSLVLHRAIGSYDHVQLYIAISEFVRQKHVEGGFSFEQIVVKPHFAWAVEPRQGPGEYFMYLGRLSPEKGVGTLLEAWTHVKAKLLIIGGGPEASRLRAAAPRNVEFRGIVQADEVPALLRGARAVLSPSIWHEGAGKVVLEAYAAGVPVLAADAGALPEVVQDQVTGLVLPPTDAQAWVQGVDRLLDDAESERMGRSGWELWSDRYSPEQGLVNIERAYRRAMSDVVGGGG
jgi:glycosyltransferase involved in cell wall biosynthesis